MIFKLLMLGFALLILVVFALAIYSIKEDLISRKGILKLLKNEAETIPNKNTAATLMRIYWDIHDME